VAIIDMHVHTDDSPDADIPAATLLARAAAEGLAGVGFVAHLDLNPDDYCYGGFNAEGYKRSLVRAEEKAQGTLLLRGIEVGEPHRFEDAAAKVADYSKFDFITGALHAVREGGMVLGPEAWGRSTPEEIIREYISETLEMTTTADMDVLAHFGLFRRGMAMAGLDTSFDETDLFPEEVDAVLGALIERKIALEVNTSGLRRLEKTTYPIPSVIRRYRQMGGRMITLGSDTHREPWVFYGLEEGRKLLLEIGFSEAYTFVNRTPESYSII